MLVVLILCGVLALAAGRLLLTRGSLTRRNSQVPVDRTVTADTPDWQLHALPDLIDLKAHPVSVVIPTLNEERSLPWVLRNLPEWVSEVVLVDGLSTDRTEAVARRMRPDVVVVHQHQRGKGAALRAGFAAASGEIIVMIDADGSTDPREMPRFVEALLAGADFVKGSRHIENGGSADFTRIRSAGNRVFVTLANLLYRSRFTDLCYGYCAFWRHHVEALALTADGFEIETQLVLNAVKAGLAIEEVPSFELQRRAGTSNLNAVRDGTRVLRTMLEERASTSPGVAGQRAGIDLVQQAMPNGVVFQVVPGAQRELAA